MKTAPFLFSVFLVLFSASGFAQGKFDARSEKLLDQVSRLYQSYRTLSAELTVSFETEGQGTQTQQGTLALERASGKYYIQLGDREIINNGKTQWTVLNDQGEVQVTPAPTEEGLLTPATLFTFFKKGYSGSWAGVKKEGGRNLEGITLKPQQAGGGVESILLYINTQSGEIDHAQVQEAGGVIYQYKLRNLKVNPAIPYQTFVFNPGKYSGLEIVDLR